MPRPEKTENQRNVFDFLLEHLKSLDTFTKDELQKVTDWTGKSFPTYWSKQYKQFVSSAGGDLVRVSDAFRPYAKWEAFQRHVTQVRGSSDYTLFRHDAVLIFRVLHAADK